MKKLSNQELQEIYGGYNVFYLLFDYILRYLKINYLVQRLFE